MINSEEGNFREYLVGGEQFTLKDGVYKWSYGTQGRRGEWSQTTVGNRTSA